MTEPSSRDLHPATGARFAFDRVDSTLELGAAPVYAVRVYLPEGRGWAATLAWDDGQATLAPVAEQPEPGPTAEEQAWVEAEALKLARVLHRDPRPHMLRWRG